jgi:uncharacterized protein YdaU (DUF1376 family)
MSEKSTKTDAWMPLYLADYLRDTTHLSAEEHGAYLLLLMHAWVNDGLLPDDDRRLRQITKMEAKGWKYSAPILRAFFYSDGAHLRQKRMDGELLRARTLVDQRVAAGKASAESRKTKRNWQREVNERSTSVATEAPTEPPTNDEREPQRNGRPSPSPIPSGIPTPLENTETSVCVSGHTQISGFFKTAVEPRPGLDLQQVWEGFCDHYPEPKRTLAKWRQWWANERIPSPGGQGAPPPVPAVDAAELTRKRIAEDDAKVVPMPDAVRASLAALAAKAKGRPDGGADGGSAIAAEA